MKHSSNQKRVLARTIAKELTPEEVQAVTGGCPPGGGGGNSKYITTSSNGQQDLKDGSADEH